MARGHSENSRRRRARSLGQWAVWPFGGLVRLVLDSPAIWPLGLVMVAITALALTLSAGLIGVPPRAVLQTFGFTGDPPDKAQPLTPPPITCAEQGMMRDQYALFSTGAPSSGPRAWAKLPDEGMFAIAPGDIRNSAYAAAVVLRGAQEGPALDQAGKGLLEAERLLKRQNQSVKDRSVIQYHWGLVDYRRGALPDAYARFKTVRETIADRRKTVTDPIDISRLDGVDIANTHAWGRALLQDKPTEGAAMLEAALADAKTKQASVAGREFANASEFTFKPGALVNLSLSDLQADAIVGQIVVLASPRTKCGDKAWTGAMGALRQHVDEFANNLVTARQSRTLSADLQLAAALVGDSAVAGGFLAPDETDVSTEARASRAVMTVTRPALVGDAGFGDDGQDNAKVWLRLQQWREYFRRGDAKALRTEFASLPVSGRKSMEDWRSQVIGSVLADPGTSKADARKILQGYADMTRGVDAWQIARVRSPFGLIAGGLLFFIVILALVGLWYAAFRVRWAYHQLFVSEHYRDRVR